MKIFSIDNQAQQESLLAHDSLITMVRPSNSGQLLLTAAEEEVKLWKTECMHYAN